MQKYKVHVALTEAQWRKPEYTLSTLQHYYNMTEIDFSKAKTFALVAGAMSVEDVNKLRRSKLVVNVSYDGAFEESWL